VSPGTLTGGVYTVVPTPFDDAGKLDVESLRRLVEFLVDAGVDGLVVLGVMGEAPKLLTGERAAVIEAALDAARGCPVVVGASHPSVAGARSLTAAAAASGAAAVLMAPPRLDRMADDDAFVAFFTEVAEGAEGERVPIVLQDHPGSTGVQLSPALIGRLAREIGGLTAVKLEDPPTPVKVSRIREQAPEDFMIFGGLGGVFLLEELGRGASGTMTGFAFPEVLLQIHRDHARGARDEAADRFYRYLPLIRFEFQEAIGLAIRKRIYRLRGLIASEHLRAPATPLDAETFEELDDLLRRLALLPAAAQAQPREPE
jgi:4-hydroxy-tetrahydrodipicolinate synthase